MDSDGGTSSTGGGIGMAGGDSGIGMAGGNKGRNERKLEAESRRKAQQRLPQALGLPPLRVFVDGTLIKDYSNSHSDLFDEIVDQTTDICWALVLALILQFAYNKDRPINQREILDVERFATKVKLTKDELMANRKLDPNATMAVGSLKKAMNHISSLGIERADGRKRPGHDVFTVKGVFVTVKGATPEEIVQLFNKYGPIGITVDITGGLSRLKEGIYVVPKPEDGSLRHALTIVAYGMTKDDKIFFGVINTWGETWGVKGHGRIMIEGTTDDIFYLQELKKK